MNDPVRVLLVDANATVRRCMRETLGVLGAEVTERRSLPSGALSEEDGHIDLAIIDCSRSDQAFWERLHATLELTRGSVPIIPTSVKPDLVPAPITARPEVAVPLSRPFTPRQLCFAAFMVQPRLRPLGGEPPFPRRGGSNVGPAPTPHYRDEGWEIPEDGEKHVFAAPIKPVESPLLEMEGFDDLDLLDDPTGAESIAVDVDDDDLDILGVEEAEPVPEWSRVLAAVMPVISREGWSEVRARLIAATLAVEGAVDEPYWRQPDVSKDAADHIEALGQTRGFRGDLDWMPTLAVMAQLRDTNARGILEIEDGWTAMRLSIQGDRLMGWEPRERLEELRLGRLLVETRALREEDLIDVLRAQAGDDTAETLGQTLLGHGMINQETLDDALSKQARGYLKVALLLEKGQFSFRRLGPPVEGPIGAVGMSLTRLSLDLLSAGEVERTELPEKGLIVPDVASRMRLADDVLTPEELRALDALRGGLIPVAARKALKSEVHEPEAMLGSLISVGLLNLIPT